MKKIIILLGCFFSISCKEDLPSQKKAELVVFSILDNPKYFYVSVDQTYSLYSNLQQKVVKSQIPKVQLINQKNNNIAGSVSELGKNLFKVEIKQEILENDSLTLKVIDNVLGETSSKPERFSNFMGNLKHSFDRKTQNLSISFTDDLNEKNYYSIHLEAYKDGKLLPFFAYRRLIDDGNFFGKITQEFPISFSFSYYDENNKFQLIDADELLVKVSKINKTINDFIYDLDEQSSATRLGVFEFIGFRNLNLSNGYGFWGVSNSNQFIIKNEK